MQFSERTAFVDEHSSYGLALQAERGRGRLLDLTVSNPTRCGLDLPSAVVEALANPAAMQYDPHPLGMRATRATLATMLTERQGAAIQPDQLLLTASTSESYSFLLRLFCNPGDAILVPSPSYPLFELLARLHDVELVPYQLRREEGWRIDPAVLHAAVTPATRAVVAIHPNNPTGHFCDSADRAVLREFAQSHDLPLIVDEVFLDYPVEHLPEPGFLARGDAAGLSQREPDALTFVLGGLSKSLCMPQMKLGWMVVDGPPTLAAEAMARLEVVADTFLSVGTPSQVALPAWLSYSTNIVGLVRHRLLANLRALDRALVGTAVTRLPVDAGWTVVLRVPAIAPDEDLAVELLHSEGLVLHPGSFYGFGTRGWLVASLLPREEIFREGIAALVRFVARFS